MRTVIQRVKEASVFIDGASKAAIGSGLLILAGFEASDNGEDLEWMVRKITNLRIFDDSQGVMNLSVLQAGGQLMVVSQFTLLGDARGGRRPSFIAAARPEEANALYEKVVADWRARGLVVETGVFGADMAVSLVNDGPVTLLLDSQKLF